MRACLLFLFIIVVIPSYAHNAGNISGTVSDIKNGSPLIGVYVWINNSLITTTTDLEGKFELKNIQIGNYEVSFSYIGYKTVIQNATVKENMTDTLKVKLEESVTGSVRSNCTGFTSNLSCIIEGNSGNRYAIETFSYFAGHVTYGARFIYCTAPGRWIRRNKFSCVDLIVIMGQMFQSMWTECL